MPIHYRIGIDPDLKASGYALVENKPFEKQKIIAVSNPSFWVLCELIKHWHINKGEATLIVCIEAGWLNKKSNYHGAFNKEIAARIGKNVGENHAVGKLLEEYCQFNQIPYKLIRPTTEKWDSRKFKMITGYEKRTNQEIRDAVKIAWL